MNFIYDNAALIGTIVSLVWNAILQTRKAPK